MRYLMMALMAGSALMLGGCPTISGQLDEATGTTLEERCASRRAAVAAWDALEAAGSDLAPSDAELRLVYQIYINSVCPPPGT